MKLGERLSQKVKGHGRTAIKVGAGIVGLGLGALALKSSSSADVAGMMSDAERDGRADDIDRLMESYNKTYRTQGNKSYRKERGLKERNKSYRKERGLKER